MCGLLGKPDTTYNDASGRVGPDGGTGGASGAGAERTEAMDARFEAGIGSMLLRCLIPRTREALSLGMWWETAAPLTSAGDEWSMVTYSGSSWTSFEVL